MKIGVVKHNYLEHQNKRRVCPSAKGSRNGKTHKRNYYTTHLLSITKKTEWPHRMPSQRNPNSTHSDAKLLQKILHLQHQGRYFCLLYKWRIGSFPKTFPICVLSRRSWCLFF